MTGRNAPCPCGSGKKYKHCCIEGDPAPSGAAVARAPADAEAAFARGMLLLNFNHLEESVHCFRSALAANPRLAPAHNNLGIALKNLGRWPEAMAAYRAALAVDRSYAPAQSNLGDALNRQGDMAKAKARLREPALRCFRKVLESEPEHATAAHFAAALSGANPEHSQPAYVQRLFDDAAAHFNEQLVDRPHYKAPLELAQLARLSADRPAPWDILDLGCGTGLFGNAMAAQRRRLVGVDLSANMLRQAQALGVYNELAQAELVEFLSSGTAQSHDLIAALDVFIYLGKLDELAALVSRALRPGGLFAFSAETDTQPIQNGSSVGYRLQPSGRYVHQRAYLEQLAAHNGFEVKCVHKTSLRLENARAVPGWLMIWQA